MESLGGWVRVPQLRLRFGLITVGWAFLLWQAIELFRPDSSLLPTYSSDDAIPLLMANEPRMTPFSLFFYGQDRFGAWPFLIARALGWLGHFSWSPELLSAYLTLFMFAAAWPLWALGRLSSDRRSRAWFVAASISSVLAVWISPLSGIILFVIAMLEWTRSRKTTRLEAASG